MFLSLDAEPGHCATSLDEYAGRVALASGEIERIKSEPEYGPEGADRVKRLLPVTETVETGIQTVRVDNAWLHELLDKYTTAARAEDRQVQVEQAASRLSALEEHLERLGNEGGLDGVEEAAQRDRLRNILGRPEFNEKKKDPIAELIKEVRRRIMEFLAEIWNRIRWRVFGRSSEVGTIFRIAFILVLAAALWFAIRMALRFKPAKKARKEVTVLGEAIEAGTGSSDLVSVALAAAGAGDFRTGVRKLYIALLYELSERNLIELEPQATNREYLRKVSRFARLAGPMSYLTEKFEYFWYGMFPSSKDDFSDYLSKYQEAVADVRSLQRFV